MRHRRSDGAGEDHNEESGGAKHQPPSCRDRVRRGNMPPRHTQRGRPPKIPLHRPHFPRNLQSHVPHLPDGNHLRIKHDPEGNPTEVKDHARHVLYIARDVRDRVTPSTVAIAQPSFFPLYTAPAFAYIPHPGDPPNGLIPELRTRL